MRIRENIQVCIQLTRIISEDCFVLHRNYQVLVMVCKHTHILGTSLKYYSKHVMFVGNSCLCNRLRNLSHCTTGEHNQ